MPDRGPWMRLAFAAFVVALVGAAPAGAGPVQRVSFGPAGGNGAEDVSLGRATPDLATILCATRERLTADDPDTPLDPQADIYACAGPATERLSVGDGSASVEDSIFSVQVSDDGSRAFFSTAKRLLASDADDGQADIYMREGGVTTQVSTGPADTNGSTSIGAFTISADGSRVLFFAGGGKLLPDDPGSQQLYLRDGATLNRVLGSAGLSPETFLGGAADLSTLVFTTNGPEVPADTNAVLDVFGWNQGTTSLLSPGPDPPAGTGFVTQVGDVSDDGTRVLFTTDRALVAEDLDTKNDLYLAHGGSVTLLSPGPPPGPADASAFYAGASRDATRAFFCTQQSLVAQDVDTKLDLYELVGSTVTLVSPGTADLRACTADLLDAANDRSSVSASGDRVIFLTAESLVPADIDTKDDLYERGPGGTITLLTPGRSDNGGARDAKWQGSSADGRVVFFATAEPLVTQDVDAEIDVYANVAGKTVLVTPTPVSGPASPNEVARSGNAHTRRTVAEDGGAVVISTRERLTADDTDSSLDLYKIAVDVPIGAPAPGPDPTPPATQVPAAAPAPETPGAPAAGALSVPAVAAAAFAPLPSIAQLVSFPSTRQCVSRRSFRIRLLAPRGLAVRSASVFVAGRKVAVRRGARLTAPVDLRSLPKGRFDVRITVTLADGRVVSGTRHYRTCTPKERSHRGPRV